MRMRPASSKPSSRLLSGPASTAQSAATTLLVSRTVAVVVRASRSRSPSTAWK